MGYVIMCFKLRKHMCNFLAFFLASLYWLFSRFLDFSCLRERTKIKLSGTENTHRNRFPFALCICLDVPLLKAVNIILFHVIDYYRRQEINHTIYLCTGWESISICRCESKPAFRITQHTDAIQLIQRKEISVKLLIFGF